MPGPSTHPNYAPLTIENEQQKPGRKQRWLHHQRGAAAWLPFKANAFLDSIWARIQSGQDIKDEAGAVVNEWHVPHQDRHLIRWFHKAATELRYNF